MSLKTWLCNWFSLFTNMVLLAANIYANYKNVTENAKKFREVSLKFLCFKVLLTVLFVVFLFILQKAPTGIQMEEVSQQDLFQLILVTFIPKNCSIW